MSGNIVGEQSLNGEIPSNSVPSGDINIDHEFDPQSPNAQSGIALAPVLQNRLELYFEGNTYKAGQWVAATVQVIEMYDNGDSTSHSYFACLLCIADHIAKSNILNTTDSMFKQLFDADTLTLLISYSAVYDEHGNNICDTYATKVELDSATKGEKGDPGEPGEDGVSITKIEINVNGELIISLSDGSVSNLGSVKGEKGEPGAKGDPGEKGDKGDTGEKGEKGDTGPKYILTEEDKLYITNMVLGEFVNVAEEENGQ